MLKFELYKLWLGFIEKLILLILAAVIIPLVIGKVFIPSNNGLDMVCYDYCACCFLCLSQSKIAKIM